MFKDNRSFFEKLTGSVSLEEPEREPVATAARSTLGIENELRPDIETGPSETGKWAKETADEEGQLTIDVYQTPTHIVVQAPMAGVKPNDVDVSINHEMITIRGRREQKKEAEGENYYYQELYWGSFSRSILLPEEVDSDHSEASFKNGLLTIKLPKLEKEEAQHIKVKTREE